MKLALTLPFIVALSAACNPMLTREEAAEANDEAELSNQAAALTSSTVEFTTDFTIGDAVERAAEEIRSFYVSQLPCAEVTLEVPTLTVEYGANGPCFFRGQSYSGTHRITVSRNEEAEVIVDHVWENLSNQRVKVSGAATVTWSLQNRSRHVEHTLDWTRLSDGRSATGSGDFVQRALPESAGGLAEGITIEGERKWKGESGEWDLDINKLTVHWQDPVPRSGSLVLDTPFDKTVDMTFREVDADTIRVTVSSGNREFSFDVHSLRLAD